jgi:hypothetical protein
MKHLLTTAALTIALAACAEQHDWAYTGQGLLLPDGHTKAALIAGSVCADPNCIQQDTVTADVITSYDSQGRLRSVVQNERPVVAPAGALAWGQVLVPAAATVGAGALIRSGEIAGANTLAAGNLAAATANAQGMVSAADEQAKGVVQAAKDTKPANTNINVQGSIASANAAGGAGGSASAVSAASATGGAGGAGGMGGAAAVTNTNTNTFNPTNVNSQFQQQQQQQQQQQKLSVPSQLSVILHPSSLP